MQTSQDESNKSERSSSIKFRKKEKFKFSISKNFFKSGSQRSRSSNESPMSFHETDDETSYTKLSPSLRSRRLGIAKESDRKNLEFFDINKKNPNNLKKVFIHVISGEDLIVRDSNGTSDPFIKIYHEGRELAKTKVVARNLHPIWNETFDLRINLCRKSILEFKCFDKDPFTQEYMGTAYFDLSSITHSTTRELELKDEFALETEKKYWGKIKVMISIVDESFNSVDEFLKHSPDAFGNKRALHPLELSRDSSIQRYKNLCSKKHVNQETDCIENYRIQPNLLWPTDYFKLTSTVQLAEKQEFQFSTGIIHIFLVSANDIFLQTSYRNEEDNQTTIDSTKLPDCYVCFKYGNIKKKSKVIRKSSNPIWREDFEFKIYPDANHTLDIFLRHDFKTNKLASSQKSTNLAMTSISLDNYPLDMSEVLEIPLKFGKNSKAKLTLVLTLTGLADAKEKELESYSEMSMKYSDTETDADIQKNILHDIHQSYSTWRTFSNLSDVGLLRVNIIRAVNLQNKDPGIKVDPYAVVILPNFYARTHTVTKDECPEFKRTFIFPVTDITGNLKIAIYDDKTEPVYLGQVLIPFLNIKNNRKKAFFLKNEKGEPTKGTVILELFIEYNLVRAVLKAAKEPDDNYLMFRKKFRLSNLDDYINDLKESVNRLHKFVNIGKQLGGMAVDIMQWKRPYITSVAYIFYNMAIWFSEPYMIPMLLVLGLFLSPITSSLALYIGNMTTDNKGKLFEEIDDDGLNLAGFGIEEIKDENKKIKIKEKWKTIQGLLMTIETKIKFAADILEKIYGIFNWSSPWISWVLMILFSIVTVVLYFVPFRIILTLLGMKLFLKPLLFPHIKDTNELFNLISRIPSLVDLEMYRELKESDVSIMTKKKT